MGSVTEMEVRRNCHVAVFPAAPRISGQSALDARGLSGGSVSMVREEIEGRLAPFAQHRTELGTIPRTDKRTAAVRIAELGRDVSCFPSDRHLPSRAAL